MYPKKIYLYGLTNDQTYGIKHPRLRLYHCFLLLVYSEWEFMFQKNQGKILQNFFYPGEPCHGGC